MKILVTGVAGFIGSNVARQFILNGHDVFGIDDLSNGHINNIPKDVEFIKGDLSNRDIKNKLPLKCDYILHLAGQSSGEISFDNPIEDLNKNTVSTLNLIEYGIEKKVKKFLYASSMSVYGNVNDSPTFESTTANPLSCYGIGKLASERYLEIFSKDLPFLNLRMFNVYGPGQIDHFINEFVERCKQGEYYIKGNDTRSFCYVDDAVRMTDILIQTASNQTVNVGQDVETRISVVAKLIMGYMGINPDRLEIRPGPVGSATRRCPDTTLVQTLTGFTDYTPLEIGLRKTVESLL